MPHLERARFAEQSVVSPQRRAKGPSTVTCGGLDIKLFKGCFAQNAAVRYAIQAYATGDAQTLEPRLFVDVSCHAEKEFLSNALDASGNVSVMLVKTSDLVVVSRPFPKIGGVTR